MSLIDFWFCDEDYRQCIKWRRDEINQANVEIDKAKERIEVLLSEIEQMPGSTIKDVKRPNYNTLMKVIAIGDIHGRDCWKAIVNENTWDKVVFIGDYFDSDGYINPRRQMNNFLDIIAFKKQHPRDVILLFGNHEFHYLSTTEENYAGFQPLFKFDIGEILNQAIKERLLQMCYVYDKFVFTHAGITKTWIDYVNIGMENFEKEINDLFYYQPNAFKFRSGVNHSKIGDDITQSPIWVRPNSLLLDGIDNFIQVFGHTSFDKLYVTGYASLVNIDTLGTTGEFLIIEDGVMSVGRTKIY